MLFDYHYWARDRILEKAARLTDQQLREPTSYSHGSLQATLQHLLFAEWVWRQRCQERNSPKRYENAATFDDLQLNWRREEQAMRAYLGGLQEEDLERIVRYQRLGGEPQANLLWQILVHLVVHGAEHRAEAAAILTSYDRSPGDIDFIHYLRAWA